MIIINKIFYIIPWIYILTRSKMYPNIILCFNNNNLDYPSSSTSSSSSCIYIQIWYTLKCLFFSFSFIPPIVLYCIYYMQNKRVERYPTPVIWPQDISWRQALNTALRQKWLTNITRDFYFKRLTQTYSKWWD